VSLDEHHWRRLPDSDLPERERAAMSKPAVADSGHYRASSESKALLEDGPSVTIKEAQT